MSIQCPRVAAGQIVGDRERQEDDFGIHDLGPNGNGHDRLLVVVADGMGGHAGGAEAAHCTVRHFLDTAHDDKGPLHARLRPALDAANRALNALKQEHPELEDAGCTFVAAAVENGSISWISIGDSSLQLLRHGVLRRLNEDHSMRPVLDELVQVGRMTTEEAEANPNRNALRSALSGDELKMVDYSVDALALKPGDQIILASDGLETLNEGEIAKVLTEGVNRPLSTVVDTLLDRISQAKARNQDNTTVALYRAKLVGDRRLGMKPVRSLLLWPLAILVALLIGAVAVWFLLAPTSNPVTNATSPTPSAVQMPIHKASHIHSDHNKLIPQR